MGIGDNEKQIQSAMIEVLQDCVKENNKTIRRLQFIIVLLIILLFGSFIYYVYSFNQYDFEDVITTTTSTNKNDNITFDKDSPITATIQDIKVNSKE